MPDKEGQDPLIAIFDLDGTLADCVHRRHHVETPGQKDWKAFYAACGEDPLIKSVSTVFRALHNKSWRLLIVTGRPEDCKFETIVWLKSHVLFYDALYMRKSGDHRADDIVKREILAQIRTEHGEPIIAFDDRDRVVDMWRSEGITCAQVAPGDF